MLVDGVVGAAVEAAAAVVASIFAEALDSGNGDCAGCAAGCACSVTLAREAGATCGEDALLVIGLVVWFGIEGACAPFL